MRVLSAEEVAALSKAGGRSLAKPDLRARRHDLPPACNHEFVADKTLVSSPKFQEFPTKRCTLCNIWLIGAAEDIPEISDMGEWLG